MEMTGQWFISWISPRYWFCSFPHCLTSKSTTAKNFFLRDPVMTFQGRKNSVTVLWSTVWYVKRRTTMCLLGQSWSCCPYIGNPTFFHCSRLKVLPPKSAGRGSPSHPTPLYATVCLVEKLLCSCYWTPACKFGSKKKSGYIILTVQTICNLLIDPT